MENVHFILFEGGQKFDLAASPTGKADTVGGICRDVLSVMIRATHAEALAAFGKPWELHVTEMENNEPVEKVYPYDTYTVLASICDNMDGTVTVRVAREATVEEDLQVQVDSANATIAEQNEIINILAGGAM